MRSLPAHKGAFLIISCLSARKMVGQTAQLPEAQLLVPYERVTKQVPAAVTCPQARCSGMISYYLRWQTDPPATVP